MSNIDPLTGLPELPEGYFWQVSHPLIYDYPGFRSLKSDRSRLRVSLRKTRESKKVTKEFRGKNWFTRVLFAWEKVEQETEGEVTDILFSRDCKGVHPQAILNAANVIMKEWRKEQETAKLVGVYPPKRLDL